VPRPNGASSNTFIRFRATGFLPFCRPSPAQLWPVVGATASQGSVLLSFLLVPEKKMNSEIYFDLYAILLVVVETVHVYMRKERQIGHTSIRTENAWEDGQ